MNILIVLASVALSAGIRFLLEPYLGRSSPFITFFLAVAVASWYGGFWPGLSATVLGLIVGDFFFAVPRHTLSFFDIPENAARSISFLLIGSCFSLLAEHMHAERRRAFEALRKLASRDERLRIAARTAGLSTWEWNAESDRVTLDDLGVDLFGLGVDGRPGTAEFDQHIHPEDLTEIVRQREAVARGESDRLDCVFRYFKPDGSTVWLRAVSKYFFLHGRPIRSVGLTLDVTDRKLSEDALRTAEKFSAAGRLAATVAHEINNPLEAVTNLLYLAASDTNLSPNTASFLHLAQEELKRVAHVTRNTLGFYRESSNSSQFDAAVVTRAVLDMYAARIGNKGLQLKYDCEPNLKVHAVEGEFRQIISNVVSNAIDAAPANSEIQVRIRRDGTESIIEIEDAGPGIAPENLPRIFDAFFTTKRDVGTGLGLWVTKSLVEKNQGTIAVMTTTEAGKSGTRMIIKLPLAIQAEGVAAV